MGRSHARWLESLCTNTSYKGYSFIISVAYSSCIISCNAYGIMLFSESVYCLPIQLYYLKYQENADLQGFSSEQIVMITTAYRNSL